MNAEQVVALLEADLAAADADGLTARLALLLSRKGDMPESLRAAMVRTFALRLAVRVMEPGFLVEG
jgi:hypothetical protein